MVGCRNTIVVISIGRTRRFIIGKTLVMVVVAFTCTIVIVGTMSVKGWRTEVWPIFVIKTIILFMGTTMNRTRIIGLNCLVLAGQRQGIGVLGLRLSTGIFGGIITGGITLMV